MDAQTVNPFTNGATHAVWSGIPPNFIGSDGYLITDISTGNLYLRTRGIWNLVRDNGPFVLAQSGSPSSVTGTTAATILASVSIPPSAVTANGMMRISALYNFTGAAGTHGMSFGLGGVTIFNNPAAATVLSADIVRTVRAANSQQSQVVMQPGAFGPGTSTGNTASAAIDLSQAQTLNFFATLGNAADTATLAGYTVEILNP